MNLTIKKSVFSDANILKAVFDVQMIIWLINYLLKLNEKKIYCISKCWKEDWISAKRFEVRAYYIAVSNSENFIVLNSNIKRN